VDVQPVRLVARGADQQIGGRQNVGHALRKPEQADAPAESLIGQLPLDGAQAPAAPRDDQVRVPLGAGAQALPRAQQRVQPLPLIEAEAADEGDLRPTPLDRQPRARRVALGVRDGGGAFVRA
jgi:hypothetical protein